MEIGNLAGQAGKGGSDGVQFDLFQLVVAIVITSTILVQHVIAPMDPESIGGSGGNVFVRGHVYLLVELQDLGDFSFHQVCQPVVDSDNRNQA